MSSKRACNPGSASLLRRDLQVLDAASVVGHKAAMVDNHALRAGGDSGGLREGQPCGVGGVHVAGRDLAVHAAGRDLVRRRSCCTRAAHRKQQWRRRVRPAYKGHAAHRIHSSGGGGSCLQGARGTQRTSPCEAFRRTRPTAPAACATASRSSLLALAGPACSPAARIPRLPRAVPASDTRDPPRPPHLSGRTRRAPGASAGVRAMLTSRTPRAARTPPGPIPSAAVPAPPQRVPTPTWITLV